MCGIFGVVAPSGRGVDPDVLWCGTHRVRHRGPDDWGFVGACPVARRIPPSTEWRWWEEREVAGAYRVGLGNRRLSILDLSEAGRMPMNLPGTELWITFNGEIYNYLELRSELAARRRFATRTDTEVLLAAYAEWGPDCLARLNGMYAFAVWDGGRERLFLARDRFGEKPLYYAQAGSGFTFGSELKQFLEDETFAPDIDKPALADLLLNSIHDHDERTLFAAARQLPPAHWMEFDVRAGKLKGPFCYWAPPVADDFDAARDREFSEKLPFLLADSIRLRLRSDVKVGFCLSGGIDSTAICALAALESADPGRMTAYTVSFPGYPEDEGDVAAECADRAGVRHVRVTFSPRDLWNGLDEMVASTTNRAARAARRSPRGVSSRRRATTARWFCSTGREVTSCWPAMTNSFSSGSRFCFLEAESGAPPPPLRATCEGMGSTDGNSPMLAVTFPDGCATGSRESGNWPGRSFAARQRWTREWAAARASTSGSTRT